MSFLQRSLIAILAMLCAPMAVWGIDPNQVLVLYNSQVADSLAVYNYYSAARPGVLGFDLNDAIIAPGSISYANFASKIRDPLRDHLIANDLEEQVLVFTMTKGLPHRVQDINAGNVGDVAANALTAFNAGNATYASVDSELTLLWLNLDGGEADGTMDSAADNHILNPYFADTNAFGSYPRAQLGTSKAVENLEDVAWRLRETTVGNPLSSPGSMYLTSRLDGNSVADVTGMIDRAQNVTWNINSDQIIIDDSSRNLDNDSLLPAPDNTIAFGNSGDDYDQTASLLTGQYPALVTNLNPTAGPFLIGTNDPGQVVAASAQQVEGPVAYLASYGQNHNQSQNEANYVNTFNGQLVDGAIFNTIESFNGRAFGGLSTLSSQGQVSQWIANGGTFGLGNVYEPFSHTVPDNELLLNNLLYNNLTFVEAAWSSIPWVSWQQIVVGDPLARITLVPEPATVTMLPAFAVLTGYWLACRRRYLRNVR
jgi:hypothetical protein